MIKSVSAALATSLLLAGAALAAPVNQPKPSDLTDAPPSTNAPVNQPRPSDLTDVPPSTNAPVNAPRPGNLTDAPSQPSLLVPAVQKIREGATRTAREHGSRAAVGRRHH